MYPRAKSFAMAGFEADWLRFDDWEVASVSSVEMKSRCDSGVPPWDN